MKRLAFGSLALALLSSSGCHKPRLDDIGPRLVSNQTAYPVMLYGARFRAGSTVHLGAPINQTFPTTLVDEKHLAAVIPAGLGVDEPRSEEHATIEVIDPDGRSIEGRAYLTIVDDIGFPTPLAMAVASDGKRVFVASPTTDEVWVYHRDPAGAAAAPPVDKIKVGDGPRALAIIPASGDHEEQLAVAHEYSGELRLLRVADPSAAQVTIAVRPGAQDLVVDGAHRRIFLSNHQSDSVQQIDLASAAVVAELPAGVNPRALALDPEGALLAVANLGGGDLSLVGVDQHDQRRVQARPNQTSIIGGRTERHAQYIMGSKAARALAWSARTKRLFVASIGPNVGPKPERVEVSLNAGVGVYDPATARFERHVSILGGTAEGMALDDARGLLYVADIGQGTIVVLDVQKLVGSDASARTAIVGGVPLPRPPGIDLIRPENDFRVQGRAGVEIHFGPKAIALTDGGKTLLALSRFSGEIAEIDLSAAPSLRVSRTLPAPPMGRQNLRRRGEVLYFTDLGRAGLTCDGCHLDGHDEGVLFEKPIPPRIYRVSTLRDIRETAPYFFPQQVPSLSATVVQVLGRIRFHNPSPSPQEVDALRLYQEMITALPNPWVGPGGALPTALTLPDGHQGSALRGLALFEGRAGCNVKTCHPAPHFTADQSSGTRGLSHAVGTPVTFPLRPEMQDAPPNSPLGIPSLTGAWDNFPLLASGAGGLDLTSDGILEPNHPFALRRVLEMEGSERHGNVAALTAAERDDLLAYLMTL